MSEFRRVTDLFSVAPQIDISDIARAAQAGFTVVINNRPDGEEPGQPTSADIMAACTAHKLYYAHIPFVGRPPERAGEAVREAIDAGAIVLAFCRSGTRSINAWAVGEVQAGTPKLDIVRMGEAAGYDLCPLLGMSRA